MRRLPVYILVDTSGSMMGEPIEQVKTGMQMLIAGLRQDPHALETVCVSVVEFNDGATQSVPMTDLVSFNPPNLAASGRTSLGKALSLVVKRAAVEVKKSSKEQQGDWKPMVFLMTDGVPTDDWNKGLQEFQEGSWGVTIGCAVDTADTSVLKQICGKNVLSLSTSDPKSISSFFKWVTASIQAAHKSINLEKKEVDGITELPPPPAEITIVL